MGKGKKRAICVRHQRPLCVCVCGGNVYTSFVSLVQLDSYVCFCEHYLHPSSTVDETVDLSESHHTPALLKEGRQEEMKSDSQNMEMQFQRRIKIGIYLF